ncbi:hypothetical protein HD554DRAFT_2167030 [Boletus coccyginus]|nr:hypothetical protein HD554DRAFT_2167030 [Boletus coccyginus]
MYALSMPILLRGGKVPTQRWVLVAMSTILILLATSLQQLLDAFVYLPADVPDYSTTYWLDYTTTLSLLKDNLYNTLVFAQDFILIWRLYVVFMYDWRVIVFPMILEAASIGTAYPATVIGARPDVGMFSSIVPSLAISACITLNVSVTMAIAGRLWWMGRTTAPLTPTLTNQYALSIYVAVESGAIFAGANIISLVLYASYNTAASVVIDVTSQLATLTPLLIIVQLGLTGQHRSSRGSYSKMVLTARDGTTFRVGVPRDSESQRAGLIA